MSDRMKFDFQFAQTQFQATPTSDETPLRILILGNFSGCESPLDAFSRAPLSERPFVRVDADAFASVFSQYSPRVSVGPDGSINPAQVIALEELQEFHPDQLCEKLASLRQLCDLRRRLLNPATFEQAADELRQEIAAQGEGDSQPINKPAATAPLSPADGASILDQILGEASARTPASSEPVSVTHLPSHSVDGLIYDLLPSHLKQSIVPKANSQRNDYLKIVDEALGCQMREVLHSNAFKSLETAWRSLRRLISNVENDANVEIFILDVTQEELLSDVPADFSQLFGWSLYRRLTNDSQPASNATAWSLIVGDFYFAANLPDLSLLGALAATAERLRAPLISAAHSSLLGCPTLLHCPDPGSWQPLEPVIQEYWQSLQQSSAAAWVGLAVPRVLLRQPYGSATDEVETFPFEELSFLAQHEEFLWGNPAYLCAEIIVRSFATASWSMDLDSERDVDDLPTYAYDDDGGYTLKPCAEIAMTGETARAVLERGMMPLISWKDRGAIRFLGFQSISQPTAPLSGPWS